MRRSSQTGFTLLETLVALVVAAAAAAVISAFLRGIMARVEKEQGHQMAALRLMNQSALLRAAPLVDARWAYENDVLRLIPAQPSLPVVHVTNFMPEDSGVPLPPIDLAFTPFQRLSIQADRYTIQFLRPALPSPVRKSEDAAITAGLTGGATAAATAALAGGVPAAADPQTGVISPGSTAAPSAILPAQSEAGQTSAGTEKAAAESLETPVAPQQ